MHRVFYRFFGSRGFFAAFLQILSGILVGTVVGIWLFLLLAEGSMGSVAEPLMHGEHSLFSVFVCGLLPILLAGLLCYIGFMKAARLLVPGFSAALMSFSSLALFWGGGYSSLMLGLLLFSGRLVSLFWLFLFLLQRCRKGTNRLGKELVLASLLTVLTLLFFLWLTGPSLEAVSIFSVK